MTDLTTSKNGRKASWHSILTFYILGICVLLPWNFFITANTYWQYKLRNLTLEENWDSPEEKLTKYQVTFTPALVIISNVVCFFLFFATSAIVKRFSEKKRILSSLWLSFVSMVCITIMSVVDTDSWQGGFFWITLLLVAILNCGMAVLQASLLGLVGMFPGSCITSLISGQSLAGIISSLAQIISLAIGDADPKVTGIIYFCIGDVVLIGTIGLYMLFLRTDYYTDTVHLFSENDEDKKISWSEYFRIFKKVAWMGFTYGFILLVTLSVFPAVQVYVTSSRSSSTWTDVYFQPTITFLLFNVADMIGREAVRWIQWPSHKGWTLHILSVSRALFIPLILLCNGENKTFPTAFHHDAWYIVIVILFAFSNGYIFNLASIYYPKFVTEEETEIAGTIMTSLLGVGIVVGSAVSPGFVALWGPGVS